MEFRIVGNENPIGSRRWFEDRVNLHLKFGWALHGDLSAAGVKAQDWQNGLGPRRPAESLFLFQALAHARDNAAGHLKEMAKELRKLEGADKASERRRLKDLVDYLQAELDYHGELFAEKESGEGESEIGLSKERLRRAEKSLEPVVVKKAAFAAAAPAELPPQ